MKEISGLTFKVDKGISEDPISFKGQDLLLSHVLELLSLPYGWDVRIEEGSVVIYDPKSK